MWPFKNKELEALKAEVRAQKELSADLCRLGFELQAQLNKIKKDLSNKIVMPTEEQLNVANNTIHELANDNEELNITIREQHDLVKSLKEEVQKLQYDNFMVNAQHSAKIMQMKLEREEQKYKDFIVLQEQVVANTQVANKTMVQMILDKLKEVQSSTVIVQGNELKQNNGYKSI